MAKKYTPKPTDPDVPDDQFVGAGFTDVRFEHERNKQGEVTGSSIIASAKELDQRSWTEMLTDALTEIDLLHTEKALRLDNDITPKQWEGLLSGELKPGKNLRHYLGTLLYTNIPGMPHNDDSYRARAYWRFVRHGNFRIGSNVPDPESPNTIDLPENRYRELREDWFNKVLAHIQTSTGNDEDESAKTAAPPTSVEIEKRLLETLHKEEKTLSHDAMMFGISQHYKQSPEDCCSGIIAILGYKDEEATIRAWLDESFSPAKKYGSTSALNFLQLYDGKNMNEEVRVLNIPSDGFLLVPNFPVKYLPRIIQLHHVSPQEAINLAITMMPERDKSFIEKKAHAGLYDHIAWPALDKEWLTKQPEEKQASLLLHTYREKAGLTRVKLGNIIGRGDTLIANLENGKNSFKSYAKDFANFFIQHNASLPENERWFGEAEAKDFIEICSRQFKKELVKPEADSHAGEWLRYYRNKAGMLRQQLGDKMGVSRQLISQWEKNGIIPTKRAEALAVFFQEKIPEFGDDEAKHFIELRPESHQKKNGKPEADAHAGEWLRYYRGKAGMSQITLGNATGIPSKTIYYFEKKGAIQEKYVNVIATFFKEMNTNLPEEQRWFGEEEAAHFIARCNQEPEANAPAGKWLRYYRKKAGLTQGEVSDATKINSALISKWENGNYIPPNHAKTLAAFFQEKIRGFSEEEAAYFIARCNQEPEANAHAGEWLRYYREKAGLTQEELGLKIDISNTAICAWEKHGSIKTFNAILLAEFFKTVQPCDSPHWFVSKEDFIKQCKDSRDQYKQTRTMKGGSASSEVGAIANPNAPNPNITHLLEERDGQDATRRF